jgi:phosphate starvation-inducible PhoH-like protein
MSKNASRSPRRNARPSNHDNRPQRNTKAVTPNKAKLRELENALLNNGRAIDEGAKRKNWTIHDLKTIRPYTQAQHDMFSAFVNNYDVCGYGSAGTGKSFLALYLALADVLSEKTETDKIIIVRSIVSVRDPGALPGELNDKTAPHEAAYHGILQELVGKSSTYTDMKDAGLIEFHTTSFLRGITWKNAVIIFDEAQNATSEEFNGVMTRVGELSKVLVLGDIAQNDMINKRKETSGFVDALKVMDHMDEFSMVRFLPQDIVRSGFVKSWIMTKEGLGI